MVIRVIVVSAKTFLQLKLPFIFFLFCNKYSCGKHLILSKIGPGGNCVFILNFTHGDISSGIRMRLSPIPHHVGLSTPMGSEFPEIQIAVSGARKKTGTLKIKKMKIFTSNHHRNHSLKGVFTFNLILSRAVN